MAENKTIPELNPAGSLTGIELLPASQDAETVKLSVQEVCDFTESKIIISPEPQNVAVFDNNNKVTSSGLTIRNPQITDTSKQAELIDADSVNWDVFGAWVGPDLGLSFGDVYYSGQFKYEATFDGTPMRFQSV